MHAFSLFVVLALAASACSLRSKLRDLIDPGSNDQAGAAGGDGASRSQVDPSTAPGSIPDAQRGNGATGPHAAAAHGHKTAKVYIEVTPAHASLYVDDKGPQALPYRDTLEVEPATHQLRVEAKGFLPHVQTVSFQRDFIFSVQLKAEPAKEAKSLPKSLADLVGSSAGLANEK